MATLIRLSGTKEDVRPKNGKYFTLKELQRLVGGYIEIVRLCDNIILIVDEEGKFKYQFNPVATRLARGLNAIAEGDYIAGNAVLCTNNEVR